MGEIFTLVAEYADGRREVLSIFRGNDAKRRARSYARMIALPDKGCVEVFEGVKDGEAC